MSERNIWYALRNAGLSEAGTAGIMGNMYCESLLKSNNVEDRCSISDAEYTLRVDCGAMNLSQFQSDAYGYGLCQWTYWTRKKELYEYAKSKGVSIGDEEMQCEFCLKEIREHYPTLYQYLQTTNDVYTAASRICCEYERPAVNNISPRASKAQEYYNRYKGTNTGEILTAAEPTTQETIQTPKPVEYAAYTAYVYPKMPLCSQGDKGIAVGFAQLAMALKGYAGVDVAALRADLKKYGIDFDHGNKTTEWLRAFQNMELSIASGSITKETWEALVK